jgi:hypothetical protein
MEIIKYLKIFSLVSIEDVSYECTMCDVTCQGILNKTGDY